MRSNKKLPTLEQALAMKTASSVEFEGSQYSPTIWGFVNPAGVRALNKEFFRLVAKEMEKTHLVKALRR